MPIAKGRPVQCGDRLTRDGEELQRRYIVLHTEPDGAWLTRLDPAGKKGWHRDWTKKKGRFVSWKRIDKKYSHDDPPK